MVIFKQQAKRAKETQRVLKERVQAERVHNEKLNQTASPSLIPALMVTHPATNNGSPQGTPLISQDKDDIDTSAPAANTRLQRQGCTLMQEYLYHMSDMPGSSKPFTNQQAATHKYPLQFFCDFE